MEINNGFIDPRLLGSSASESSEESSQDVFTNAPTHPLSESESYSNYSLLDGHYSLQDFQPSVPMPHYYTPFPSYASPYPEQPLLQPGFALNHNLFEPHLPMIGPNPSYPPSAFPTSVWPNASRSVSTQTETGLLKRRVPPRGLSQARYSTRLQAKISQQREMLRSPKSESRSVTSQKRKRTIQRPINAMSQPFSELALDMPDVLKCDLNAFIHRGRAERMRWGKDGWKICRPLNAFMLYRKAYLEIAKSQQGPDQNNLSRVLALSWRSEDEAIREEFYEYSHLEKEVHLKCFPDYLKSRRRDTGDWSDEDEETVLDQIVVRV
ncbi:hypothetical protein NUW58_g9477 [Xylaria curta]|uniref:Uncharacterized protein n=1 Tax=Xylaria curta TaxID=42375 RepID=A0ACC1MW44_9PEZI|nr:hypothetical protein NUW58_g9477 [Xylaria curta]